MFPSSQTPRDCHTPTGHGEFVSPVSEIPTHVDSALPESAKGFQLYPTWRDGKSSAKSLGQRFPCFPTDRKRMFHAQCLPVCLKCGEVPISLSHLAGVVRECVRICFSNTSFAATRSILTDKMWCSAFRHRMLHRTKSLLGHILSIVDESVRQASVTEVPRAIPNNFQPTGISIEERNPNKEVYRLGHPTEGGDGLFVATGKKTCLQLKKDCTVLWNPSVFIHPELSKHAVSRTIREDKTDACLCSSWNVRWSWSTCLWRRVLPPFISQPSASQGDAHLVRLFCRVPLHITNDDHWYLAHGHGDACNRIQHRSICDICTWGTALLATDHKNMKGLCSASVWNSSQQTTQEKV